jgi:predicted transcriptional regulator
MENLHYGFALVVNGKYWSHLCQNHNQPQKIKYFVRKGAVAPTQTEKLFFYVAKRMQVLGTADFVERIVGDTSELWSMFGAQSLFESVDEYRAFAGGSRKMTFIHFENLMQFADPKPKADVVRALGSLVWFRPRYVSESNANLLAENI